MNTDRRSFIQSMGAGAAGIGLSPAPPLTASAAPQSDKVAKKVGGRKMVVRADDIGMSKFCNYGTFEAIENGVVTAAAIMLDCPGTEDALERLKAYPWISVDWHMHMWGAPTADPKKVPSLIEKDGPFAGRFRSDLRQAADVVYEEALLDLRAQLDRCVRILGRAPDTGGGEGGGGNSPWGRAVTQVTEEYDLVTNFQTTGPPPEAYLKHVKDAQDRGEAWAKFYSSGAGGGAGAAAGGRVGAGRAPNKWADRKIFSPAGTAAYIDLLTDSISSVDANYDPVLFYTEDRFGILKLPDDVIVWQAWHPGYVDYYVYRLWHRVDRARACQYVVCRTQDVSAMCDVRLKNWIKQNRIALVTFRDALYGTSEYQNHLKSVGSDLYMRG